MDVLSEMEKTARKGYLPSIGPVKGKIIGDIIKKHKPKRILEIGTLHGYSAIFMANFLLNINNNNDNDGNNNTTKEIIVICLEIDKNLANIAKKNIEKAGLSDKIKVINGDALEIIPKLKNNNNNNHYRFDLVFIDAVKNQYLEYLKLVEKNDLMNKEAAVVVADNVLIYENEMRDYLDYVRNSGRYNSYTTETTLEFTKNVKDALEVSIRANLD
ncbi:MAG TPA: CmcI family methyltransferase [Nitrososphaeraceae archaeon]|jgi:predicted O-methyltransferase YrrM|nr:CmcI family methyltransferase [Nitrososphaeraceae archaeon]